MSLSDDQLITYARDALSAGDREAMLGAYNLLRSTTDPGTQLLACDLAIGIADLSTLTVRMIAALDADPGDPAGVLDTLFADLAVADLARLVEASALLDAADDAITADPEHYTFIAFGLIAAAADDAGGAGNLNPPPGGSDAATYAVQVAVYLDTAATMLTADGISTELLEGFGGAIGWTP